MKFLIGSATLFTMASAWLSAPGVRRTPTSLRMAGDKFTVGILGDLHIDPRIMEDYEIGREHWKKVFAEAEGNTALVSLGDLGESKSIRPDITDELFAGTTECHEIAAEYLRSLHQPYDVVWGKYKCPVHFPQEVYTYI